MSCGSPSLCVSRQYPGTSHFRILRVVPGAQHVQGFTLLEPVIIIATGGAIGLMVLSMFSAIFGITDIQF